VALDWFKNGSRAFGQTGERSKTTDSFLKDRIEKGLTKKKPSVTDPSKSLACWFLPWTAACHLAIKNHL